MPATVADVARRVDVSPSTIRNWSKEFEPFLSASAAPPAESDRIYQDDDIAVMATIAAMRQERQPFETIRAALAAGERVRLEEPKQEEEEPGQQSALVTRLMANVAKFEGELQATKQALEHTRADLSEERQARVNAEIRAATAEARLDTLTATAPPESPATPAPGQEEEAPAVMSTIVDKLPETESPAAKDAAPLTWRKRFGRWVAGE